MAWSCFQQSRVGMGATRSLGETVSVLVGLARLWVIQFLNFMALKHQAKKTS